jgi:hypothetical protein
VLSWGVARIGRTPRRTPAPGPRPTARSTRPVIPKATPIGAR